MKFALVTHGLPQPSSNGGPMTCWAIVSTMLDRGHAVLVVTLVEPNDPFNTSERRRMVTSLGAEMLQLRVRGYGSPDLPANWRNGFGSTVKPSLGTLHPAVALARQMGTILGGNKFDAVFPYHYVAIAATHGLRGTPRLAVTGDLWHWSNLRRWLQNPPTLSRSYVAWTLSTLAGLRAHTKAMAELLNDCEIKGSFGAYDAAWLRQHGVLDARYFQSPIVDACGSQWQAMRNSAPARRKPKIVTAVSNLGATSTSAMLRLFAKEILPRLERELGPDGFEVHVVGEGEPPSELAELLPRSSVILRGRVEPADPEFLSADVLLVPTPIKLGLRLRIVTGMSFGCCLVAHNNEALNIPELTHDHNALLASSGQGLADAVVQAVRDPALRQRLGANARKTYEQSFHPSVAGARIVDEIEALVQDTRRMISVGVA